MRDLNALTDQELLVRTAEGDAVSYGCLYDRYVDPIYRFVYFRVNNREEAEDVVETTFLKTLEVIQHNPAKIENLKAWLYRTAHKLVIDHYRTRKRPLALDEISNLNDQQALPEADVISLEEQRGLKYALETLEPEQQQLIACRFVHSLSHE